MDVSDISNLLTFNDKKAATLMGYRCGS